MTQAMDSDVQEFASMKKEITSLSRRLGEMESHIGFKPLVRETTHDPLEESQYGDNQKEASSLRDLVIHLFSQSSLHGLPNIVTTTHRWIKIFWCLLLLAGTGMAVWQLIEIFTEYFQYPVLTITDVHRGNVTLPQITVCNMNGYLKSELLKELRIMNHFKDEEELGQVPPVLIAHYASLLPNEDRAKLSHNISNFIYWNDDRSSVLSHHLIQRTMVGNCFTFTQTMRHQKKPFITLSINLNSDEYVKKYQRPQAFAFLREEGVFPHSYDEQPYIDLEPGNVVLVTLRMETINRLNGKYQNCQDDELEFLGETGIKYSEEVCKAVCLSKKILANCGCISYVYNSFPSRYKISKLFDNVPDCMEHNETCYRQNKYLAETDSCICKPRCDMKRYVLSDLKIKKIKDIYWHCMKWDSCMMLENDTDQWVMNNAVYLDVRFSETEHKEYRQVPGYPLSQFLSDIGGTLGLYMGVSLLTLAEIPQLIIGTVTFFIKRRVLGIKRI